MLKAFSDIADAYDAGQCLIASFRKVPSQTTAANIWFDLSMSPGNPVPNYYAAAPTVSKVLSYYGNLTPNSGDSGINAGMGVSPAKKYLHRITALTTTTTAVPLPCILCDYLMYYPFVDQSNPGDTSMTVGDTLTRYTDGAGVQIMAVEVAAQVGGATFTVNYTNSSGVAGRVTPSIVCNTQTVNGTIVSSHAAVGNTGPFLPLQAGDSGVRSIESVNFSVTDIGLISLVLVKPIATFQIYDITAASEKDFWIDGMGRPEIKDNAYLNIICCPSGTLAAAPILGTIEVFWN